MSEDRPRAEELARTERLAWEVSEAIDAALAPFWQAGTDVRDIATGMSLTLGWMLAAEAPNPMNRQRLIEKFGRCTQAHASGEGRKDSFVAARLAEREPIDG